MNDELKIETLEYVAQNNPLRAILSGDEFRGLIPAPEWVETTVRRNATVDETVAEMRKLIKKSAWQTKEIAKRLRGQSKYDTCRNIWNFLFNHIKYREDDPGKEQLRTPALSWNIRKTRGIDCDDFSIFAGTILYNLGIPYYLRIARYPKKDYFQHVYVVVPKTSKQYITVDAVLDEYDAEKQPIQTKDFLVMDDENLNGIDISVLGEVPQDTYRDLEGILSGDDYSELEGLDDIPEIEGLNAVYNHLIRTRNFVQRHPQFIRQAENPQSFLGMLDYAIGYWNTDKRDEALEALEVEEQRQNEINGIGAMPDGHEEVSLFYGLEGLSGVSLLGKAKAKKGFFKNVKKAVQTATKKIQAPKKLQAIVKKAGAVTKKIAQKAKTVIKKVIRYNPAVAAVRLAILAALKVNLLKVASRLKIGYYTEQEAKDHGFDLPQWQKARKVLQDAENLFVNKFQGKPENFRSAILTGRAGGLGTLDEDVENMEGFGVAVAAAGAASTAAAMPFLKQILDLMKGVDWSKLISKVKKGGLFKRKNKAEKEMEHDEKQAQEQATAESSGNDPGATEEAEEKTTAIPKENGEENSTTTESSSNIIDQNEGSSNSGSDLTTNSNQDSQSTTETENPNPNNLPATTNSSTPTTREIAENDTVRDEPGFFDKAKAWVMENKGTSLLIAGGLILGVVGITKASKGGLSGSGRGRKKNGNKKSHPPRSIVGIGKRRKGRGGAPQIKL